MAEVPPHTGVNVFHVDHKRRKVTPERTKANYLCGQLRLRLQYAKLKVEHGWQRQNLNEVENLYFRHMHKQRPVATPKQNRHQATVASSARYTPNMLFPVNAHHSQDIDTGEQKNETFSRKVGSELVAENGGVAVSNVSVSFSPSPAVLTSTHLHTSMEMHTPPATEPLLSQSVVNGPDSSTLEQAAASMFTAQPSTPKHGSISSSSNELVPSLPLPDRKYPSAPNGGTPVYFQPTGASYGGNGSVYPPAQAQFYPSYPYHYEFYYHTPPQATAFASQPHQNIPSSQSQVAAQSQPSSGPLQPPQVQSRRSDSFRVATPAQQLAPPNPTLTYDAFWSSHSLSAHSYRSPMVNTPVPAYQGQVNSLYDPMHSQLGVANGHPSVPAPISATSLPEIARAPSPATQPAHTS